MSSSKTRIVLNQSIHAELPVLQIPMDAAAHARTFAFDSYEFNVVSEIIDPLHSSRTLEQQSFLLLSAYIVWIYRLSGETDILVGFSNSDGKLFPIRVNLDTAACFNDLLEAVTQKFRVAEQTASTITSPYETIFHIHGRQSCDQQLLCWHFDIERKKIRIGYDASLFKAPTIARYAQYYIAILTAVLQDDTVVPGSIDLLTGEERALYAQLNDTEADYPRHQTIHGMFEKAARQYPDNIALASNEGEYSYRGLNERANRLAHFLIGKGLQKGDFVTIFMERSLETIVSLLAIMKAGGVYVPVDPEHPEERNSYIIEDTKSSYILTKEQHISKARLLSEAVDTVKGIVLVDSDSAFSTYPAHPVEISVEPQDLAYIIYTSGSTGKPKGALIAHEGVVNLGMVVRERCGIQSDDILTQFATYSFDASVWDTVGALFFGAKLYLLSPEERVSVEEFAQAIERTKTTIITILPTVFFTQLATYLSDEGYKKLANVKLITVAGEALYGEQIRSFQRKFGEQIHIVNVYGPTECTVCTTTYTVNEYIPDDLANIPIGKPIANYKTYIVNDQYQLCPIHVPGELMISTVGLARGYLNQPERTEQAFVNNPFAEGGLIYKSGDIVKLLPNGTIEYVGRRDSQIKIRGHRIEIGEIEDSFAKFPNVQDVAVIPKKEQDGQNMLVAFFTSKDQSPCSIAEITAFLTDKLPSYFVPKFICQIDHMPIAPTGKLDRKSLAKFDHLSFQQDIAAYTEPENETQRIIAQAWEQVLGRERVGIHDPIFQIGGDSLQVIHVLVLLKPHYPALKIGDFFQYRTVAELAERVQALRHDLPMNKQRSSLWEVKDLNEFPIQVDYSFAANDYGVPSHILLTGATGYLGSHLLYELLTGTKAHVYCLVRKTVHGSSRDRLQELMAFYFGEDLIQAMEGRITLVEGDLEAAQLGISPQEQSVLLKNIDTIIHAAADVRHFGDAAQFAKTNVAGTKVLLEWAESKPGVRFHHISTMGIPEDFALSGQWEAVCAQEQFDPNLQVENVYTNSKLDAERLVLDAGRRGVAVNIYRAGNLTCNSVTGKFQRNIDSNAFYRMIKAMILLGKAPQADWYVDFTPIDYASRSIIQFVFRHDVIGRLFHICHPNPILYSDMIGMIRQYGYEIETLPFDAYTDWLLGSGTARNSEGIQLAMAQLEGDGAKDSDYRYGCVETSAALQGTNVVCAPVSLEFIRTMLQYAVEIEYFPKPKVPQTLLR